MQFFTRLYARLLPDSSGNTTQAKRTAHRASEHINSKSALLLVAALLFSVSMAQAQQIAVTVSGTAVTTPALSASYTTLALALNAVNNITAYPTPGTIILTCTSGTFETAPVTGLTLGSATLNPLLSATNTITITKSAAGAVTLNAGLGVAAGPVTATPDCIMKLSGADWVTINGLTFTDGNSGSATVAMEIGLGLFKLSATDGCQNNTIQNCIFNMQRINNTGATAPLLDGAVAIEMVNSTAAAAITSLTPTAASGTNSNNKFYSNTINGGNIGIGFNGYLATVGMGPTPTASTFLGDLGNDVGGTGASGATTGNTILNFGGGAATNPAAGIRANQQWSLNVGNNTINNNNGSGVNHATTLRGIYLQAGLSANVTCTYNTVTTQGGGTATALTAIENVIGSTAAINTVNINNNIIRLAYTTATTGVMTAILNSSTAANVNINNNNIQGVASTNYPSTGTIPIISAGSPGGPLNVTGNTISNFTMTGASGTFRAITGATPTGLYSVTGNLIENLSYTTVTSTGSITGIYDLSSATLMNVNNNIIRNFSTPVTGTLNGIQNNTVAGTFQCKSNQIYNFTTSTGGAGGFSANGITWANANVDLSNNIIYAINSTGTTGGTAGTINGITHSGAATVNGNAVYNLSSNSTNVVITGITTATATGTNTVTNNLIGDLRAPNSTGNITISGMLVSGGTPNNIYHNTVNIANTTASATTSGTSAIYFSSSTPVNNLRNNVFVNTSAAGPTGGFTAAIRYTIAPTSTNFPATNNNNFYYAGTAAANKVLYCEGATAAPTNGQQTIAAYKTYINTTLPVSGRESSSVSEAPNFVSTTGSNPITTFLQYNTSIGTQIEQGGGTGTGISTDYSGTTRCPGGSCPGGATTPDMGAWELNGVALDLTAPNMTYTAVPNSACPTAPNLSVAITDASGVNTTVGTKPRLYYKKSTDANTYAGNTSADNGWKYVEASNASSPLSFAFNYSGLQSAVVSGDIIQYFVVSQDLATTPNVGINSGTFAVAPTSVNLAAAQFPLTGTINSFTIQNTIPTTVTIGAAGTYTSLTGAAGLFNAINTNALGGNTVATIIDASVTETGAVALNQIAYGCATYTLTIMPQTTATLTGAVASGALIKLNGADNVIIDGSNSGGTDKSLTITNTGTTAPVGIWVASLGVGAGATNNTIKNCNISTGVNASTASYGICVGGTTIGSNGADNDNMTIQNNTITVATTPIYVIGTASVSTGGDDNLNIIGNTVTTNTTIQNFGIQVGNALNSAVTQNTVDVLTSGSVQPVGISLETGFVSSTVTRNNIIRVSTTATGGYGGRGLTVGTGTATSNLTIANNFISGVNGSNYLGFTNSSSMGIGIGMIGSSTTFGTTTGGINLYHNSVNMYGDYTYTSAACITAAVYVGTGVTSLDMRNNLLVNTMNQTTAAYLTTARNYALYSAAANTAFSSINYNDYSVTNTTNPTQAVLAYIGSDRTNLAGIVTGFGSNAASQNIAPTFTSPSNLRLDGAANASLDNLGTTIGAVSIDIDGVTRAATPDMGAYEFTAPSCATAVGGTATATVTSLCNSGTPVITATGYSTGLQSTYQWYSSTNSSDYPSTGTLISGQTNPASLTTGSIATTTYYWLQVGCAANSTTDNSPMLTITVTPSAASITGSSSRCANDVAANTLTEAGGTGTSWLWSNAATTQAISVSPTTTTTYTVTVTSGACTATASKTITLYANPTGVTAAAAPTSLCAGNPINLSSSFTSLGTPAGMTAYTATRTTGTSYTSIVPATTITTWRNGAITDDNLSNNQPIGFAFNYNGNSYSTFRVSTNGFVTFDNASAAVGSGTGAYGYSNSWPVASGGLMLAPNWDDLQTAGNLGTLADLDNSINYTTTGTAGSRVCTVEWKGMQDFLSTSTASYNFQVKLFEADNHIEFVYGNMFQSAASVSYSLGLSAATVSATPTATELLSQTTVNSGSFGFTNQTALTPVPAANTKISFNRPVATYSWSGPNAFTSAISNPPIAAATTAASGTYTVTIANSVSGCTASSTVAVTVNALPTAGLTSANNISCSTLSSVLTAMGGTMYNFGSGFSATATSTVTSANTYTVTVQDANGCTATASVVVGSNLTPPASPALSSANNISCTTPSSVLTASGGATYDFGSGFSATDTRTVTAAGTYTVTVQDGTNGCTAIATVAVTGSSAAPSAGLTSANNISCTTPSSVLTATGGTMYDFGSGFSATATSTVTASGTYNVTVQNAFNCTSVASVVVTGSSAAPSAGLTSANDLTCAVTSSVLTASGGTMYDFGSGFSATATSTVSGAGTYSVTVQNAFACTATASVVVNSNTMAPTAVLASANDISCATASSVLTATGGAMYDFGSGFSATATSTVTSAGTYTVTVKDGTNGCTASTTVAVTANTKAPLVSIAQINPGSSLHLGDITVTTEPSGATISWTSPASSSKFIKNLASGMYTFTTTDPTNGCITTKTVTIP